MVMVPLLMPKVSWRTLATGARQLVVQEALDIGRRGYDYFFHGRAEMLLGVNTLGEEDGGFDDDIRADRSPIDFGGILGLENLEALAFDGDGVIGMRHLVGQIAEDGVVLQKMRESFRVGDVVDGDELDVLVVKRGAHNVATDAAEAVDANLNGHSSSDGWSEIAAVQERVTAARKRKMLWVARRKVNARKMRVAGQFPDTPFTEHGGCTAYFMALDNHRLGKLLDCTANFRRRC